MNLLRQLAGRRQDQRPRCQRLALVVQQALQDRQYIGGRLAATGLGDDVQILTRNRMGNRRRLNRRGLFEGQGRECLEQAFMQGEFCEHRVTFLKTGILTIRDAASVSLLVENTGSFAMPDAERRSPLPVKARRSCYTSAPIYCLSAPGSCLQCSNSCPASPAPARPAASPWPR